MAADPWQVSAASFSYKGNYCDQRVVTNNNLVTQPLGAILPVPLTVYQDGQTKQGLTKARMLAHPERAASSLFHQPTARINVTGIRTRRRNSPQLLTASVPQGQSEARVLEQQAQPAIVESPRIIGAGLR